MGKAVFYNIPASGHVNPSLPVVSQLVAAGEEVIYYAASGHRRRVEASGAVYRAYSQVPDDYFYVTGLDGSCPPATALALARTTRDVIPELLEQARRDNPDYVIYDSMCPWGFLVARILGVPSICSSTFMVFTIPLVLRSPAMFSLVAGTLRGLPQLRRYFATMGSIRREHRVPTPGYPEVFALPADLVINYTSALFQPGAQRMAGRVLFVGPSIGPRADDPEFPFDALDDRPFVYVSLGTVNNLHPEFFRTCIAAYRGSPYRIVMSVGEHLSVTDLGPIPANFIVRPQVPQLAVLERAAVFVNHAGMNSVQEGLVHGVPLIAVPQSPEQTTIARRLVRLEAGAMLTMRQMTSDRLLNLTEQVLTSDRYRHGAARLRDEIQAAGGYRRAAQEILAAVRTTARS